MKDLLLPMQMRALEDAHESRGFVPVATTRPFPEVNHQPSLYGELDENYKTPSTRPFDIRKIDGRLFINRGFLENTQVEGTEAFVSVGPSGASLWLHAEIAFVFNTFTAKQVDPADSEKDITVTHHVKAGPYRIVAARLLTLPPGAAPPPELRSPLITIEPEHIHPVDHWYFDMGHVSADGSHPWRPAWLRVSADLSRLF
jgi:hypothetical protein